jgi:hypothetical protein
MATPSVGFLPNVGKAIVPYAAAAAAAAKPFPSSV